MALTKEEKAAAKAEKLAEATQLKQLKQAQTAELTALKSTLGSQGLSSKEISALISAEKKANSTEYSDAKSLLGQSGMQYVAGDANATIYSGAGAYANNADYLNGVTTLLGRANNLYSNLGIQQVKQIAGDGSYTGVGLDQLTKAVLNQNEDGSFSRGAGDTKLKGSVFGLLNDATQNYGQTLTADQLGKVKLAGTDANGNEIYQSKIAGGDENKSYSLLIKNADGTYRNVGYTGLTLPPKDDGGFFGSTIGKIALAAGAWLTGGAILPTLTGTLGAIGGGAATGSLLGAGTSALTGGNLLKGAVIGGVTGGALSAAAPYISQGLNAITEGISDYLPTSVAPSTTTPTMASQYGNLNLPTVGDLTAGTGIIGEGLNPNIIRSVGKLNDLQALGVVSPQAAATAGNFLYSGVGMTPQAALDLGINPTVLQPTTMSGLSQADVNTALDFGLSSSTTAPMGSGEFQQSVLDTARQVNEAQTALGDLYSGNTADKLLAQSQPYTGASSFGNLGLSGILRGLSIANSLFNRPNQPRAPQMLPDGTMMPYGEVDYSGLFNLLGSQSSALKKQQSLLG